MRRRQQRTHLTPADALAEVPLAVDERTLDLLEQRPRSEPARRRRGLVRRALVTADVLGLVLAFLAAQLFVGSAPGIGIELRMELFLFVLTLPVWVLVAKLYGLYDRDEPRTDHSTLDDVVLVFHLVTVGTWALFAVTSVVGIADPNLRKLALFWLLAIAFVTIGRTGARAVIRRHAGYRQSTVIVGAGDVGQLLARKFVQHPEYGIDVVGFVDSDPKELREDLRHLALLGPPERLPSIVRLFGIERVVIAFPNYSEAQTLELVRLLKDLDVQIDIAPQLFEVIGPTVGIHTVEGFPLIGLPRLRLSRTSRVLKRTMDIVVSVLGLLLLAPVFLLFALLIKLDSPGPVFFRQVRMGAGDRTFDMLKFRTMFTDADRRKVELAHLNIHARSGAEALMFKIQNDPRVTRVGRFLRRYFLDELPQLINVLKGEMSLVGPRPLILDEDQHVGTWARRRLDLKPGMTGLWQVLGRSAIPFDEMIKLDYLYVTTWSLGNDIRLLFRTIPLVARGEAGGY